MIYIIFTLDSNVHWSCAVCELQLADHCCIIRTSLGFLKRNWSNVQWILFCAIMESDSSLSDNSFF